MKKGIFIAIIIAILVIAVITYKVWLKKKLEDNKKAVEATVKADMDFRAKNPGMFTSGGAIFVPDPNKDNTGTTPTPTGTSSLVRQYVS